MKTVRDFRSFEEMQTVHQEEVNAFPMVFIFGRKTEEKLLEAVRKIGSRKEDCVSLMGCGDVMRKSDVPAWNALCRRHEAEMNRFMEKEFCLA